MKLPIAPWGCIGWYWPQHWILKKFTLSTYIDIVYHLREFNLRFFWSLQEVTMFKNWSLINNEFWLKHGIFNSIIFYKDGSNIKVVHALHFDVHRKFFSNNSIRKNTFFKVKQVCESSPLIMENFKFSVQFFRGPWLDWLWLTKRLF